MAVQFMNSHWTQLISMAGISKGQLNTIFESENSSSPGPLHWEQREQWEQWEQVPRPEPEAQI